MYPLYRREYKMNIIFKVSKYLKKNIKLVISIICIIGMCVSTGVSINYKNKADATQTALSDAIRSWKADKDQLIDLQEQVTEYEDILIENEKTIEELNNTIEELTTEVEEYNKPTVTASNSNNSKNTTKDTPKTNTTTTKTETEPTVKDTNVSGYDQSRQVWNYLKSLGLNDYVCAGILGNIMAEVGGQTLDISSWPKYSTGSYYGICQWSGSRKSRLLNNFGSDLDAQLRFLGVELYEEIPSGSSFYTMQDEKEAALYFAKNFERCSSQYYSIRQTNATKALEYFT